MKKLLFILLAFTFISAKSQSKKNRSYETKTGLRVLVGDFIEFSNKDFDSEYNYFERGSKNFPIGTRKITGVFKERRLEIHSIISFRKKTYAVIKYNKDFIFADLENCFYYREAFLIRN